MALLAILRSPSNSSSVSIEIAQPSKTLRTLPRSGLIVPEVNFHLEEKKNPVFGKGFSSYNKLYRPCTIKISLAGV